MCGQTGFIHLKFGDEPSTGAFVPIRSFTDASVALLEWLESEARKTEPRSANMRAFAYRQIEPSYWKEISRRAEIEIYVRALANFRAGVTVQLP